METLILLVAYPFGIAIGTALGCWTYFNIKDFKEQRAIKTKININRSQGKETCQICYSGLTLNQIREKSGKRVLCKCLYCGGDTAATINDQGFLF